MALETGHPDSTAVSESLDQAPLRATTELRFQVAFGHLFDFRQSDNHQGMFVDGTALEQTAFCYSNGKDQLLDRVEPE
jgi:hypothetical protein